MSVRGMPLADIVRACRDQTDRFVRGEPRDDAFCFELFRRAIGERESFAWEAIVAQYRGIALAAIHRHAAAAVARGDEDFWVNRAFQRFWMAIGPDRFHQFADVPSLVKYLKLCVHSVLLDEVRARRGGRVSSFEDLPASVVAPHNPERAAVGALAGLQLWSAITAELQDEAERQVTLLSFARNLKPAEIHARHPDLFASVADVYRVKRNVLDRLRRSPRVLEFVGR